MENKWFAVMTDHDDNDWGTGSFDQTEAEKMVVGNIDTYPKGYIAVIENGECIDELEQEDFSAVYYHAAMIQRAKDWNDCIQDIDSLMELLGLEDEWKESDGETFMVVIRKAGEMIGIKLV